MTPLPQIILSLDRGWAKGKNITISLLPELSQCALGTCVPGPAFLREWGLSDVLDTLQ